MCWVFLIKQIRGLNLELAGVAGLLWMLGRGKPRLGGLTIKETSDRQDSARKATDKLRKERLVMAAARMMVPEMKCELDGYEYVLVQK
jgi:hypothetical protein